MRVCVCVCVCVCEREREWTYECELRPFNMQGYISGIVTFHLGDPY